MWSFTTPLSVIVVVVTVTGKNERTISAFHVSAFSICAYTFDTFDFSHFPYPPQFVFAAGWFYDKCSRVTWKAWDKERGREEGQYCAINKIS